MSLIIAKPFLFSLSAKEDTKNPSFSNIMYDGIKVRATNYESIQTIVNHPALQFKSEVTVSTGEQGAVDKAKHKGLLFEHVRSVTQPAVYIRGSLPAYYNGSGNYTNLSLGDSHKALHTLVEDFKLPPSTEVIKLECGVNLQLPEEIAVDRFTSNILVYKGKQPTKHTYERGGSMVKFDLSEFSIKIYNKSAQQRLHTNVMRYELVIERKTQLNRFGIRQIRDLLKPEPINALKEKLLDVTKHLIFHDKSMSLKQLTRKQLETFWQYGSAQAWTQLMTNNPELYRKKKKAFAAQMTRASGISWNKLFYEWVDKEAGSLLNND